MSGPVYALNLFNVADRDEYLAYSRRSAKEVQAHGGKVVTESFDGRPGAEFTGTSWSVYDEHADLWRQTWVDDTGNYFALEGRFADDEMTLICDRHNSPERDVVYRMRFSEITDNAFVWRWERATEAGAVFELRWQIEYLRQA